MNNDWCYREAISTKCISFQATQIVKAGVVGPSPVEKGKWSSVILGIPTLSGKDNQVSVDGCLVALSGGYICEGNWVLSSR